MPPDPARPAWTAASGAAWAVERGGWATGSDSPANAFTRVCPLALTPGARPPNTSALPQQLTTALLAPGLRPLWPGSSIGRHELGVNGDGG